MPLAIFKEKSAKSRRSGLGPTIAKLDRLSVIDAPDCNEEITKSKASGQALARFWAAFFSLFFLTTK